MVKKEKKRVDKGDIEEKARSRRAAIIKLVIGLVAVVCGGVLFVGAVSGWFSDSRIALDEEYYGEGASFMELSAGEYEGLVNANKSFVVFVDQGGCTTADRLREYTTKYMTEAGILVYRMLFSEVKNTSLYEKIKYYPSIAIISHGRVAAWLRADSDEDAASYNSYDDFVKWMDKYLEKR